MQFHGNNCIFIIRRNKPIELPNLDLTLPVKN